MPERYNEYHTYPGRQMECVIVPRRFPHFFFEGIQSISVSHNADEYKHGQYEFNSNIIVERSYTHTSGTISLKGYYEAFENYSNVSYALRGMTNQDPSTSQIFDPTRLTMVDMGINVLSWDRRSVLRSSWFADFLPNIKETDSLDDIGVTDLDFSAARKVDFEGYQIVYQEFMDTKSGDQDFTLFYPALVSPELDSPTGTKHRKIAHELCPITNMLRVIVGGTVLKEAGQASTHTIGTGYAAQTVLHLSTPIGTPGTPVIAFWLADGKQYIGGQGITAAPVMSFIRPGGDWTLSGAGWDGSLEVYFTEALRGVEDLAKDSNNEFANFRLSATEVDGLGNIVAQGEACPFDIGGANSGADAKFTIGVNGERLVSRNMLTLSFINSVGWNSLPSAIPVSPGNTLYWNLSYRPYNNQMPLHGEDSGSYSPSHALDIPSSGFNS